NVERAFGILARKRCARAGLERPMQIEQGRVRLYGRLRSECLARDQPCRCTAFREDRKVLGAEVRKRGIRLLALERQCDPGLDSIERAAFAPRTLEALGMRDPASRGHPVDFARANRLLGADTVP